MHGMTAPAWVSSGLIRFSICFACLAVIAAPTHAQGLSAKSRLDLSDSLWNSGERLRSMALLDSLSSASAGDLSREERLQALLRSGSRWISLGEAKKSESASRAALELAGSLGDSTALRSSLRWLSVAASTLGRSAEARELCVRLLAFAKSSGDRHHEGWALVGLGWSDFNAGNAEEADREFACAAQIFREIDEQDGFAWAQNSRGMSLARLQHYAPAREAYEQAAQAAQRTDFRMVEAMALNNLAGLEYSLGDPGVALQRFSRAGKLQAETGNRREAIVPALNVAICQIDLGRYDEAEENLTRQLRECRDNGYRDLEGDVLTMLSNLQRERGQLHSAAAYLRQALALGPSLNTRTRLECLIGLSDVLAEMDSCPAAFDVIRSLPETLSEARLGEIGQRLAIARADRLLTLGKPGEALRALEKEFALSSPAAGAPSQETQVRNEGLQIQALVLAARAQRNQGAREQALASLTQAATLWEQQRGAPLDPEWREQRGKSGAELYSMLAAMLFERAGTEPSDAFIAEIFDRLQMFKARTLDERMRGPEGPAESRDEWTQPPVAELEDLQRRLEPGDLFLDFFLGHEASLVIAVTREERRIVSLPPEDAWNASVHDFLDLVSAPPSAGGTDARALARIAHGLHSEMFGSLTDLLKGSSRIIVAPDGILSAIPFAYLHSVSSTGASEHETSPEKEWARVPSVRIWLTLRDRPQAARTRIAALALADGGGGKGSALPGSEREVRALARGYQEFVARTAGPRDSLAAKDLSEFDLLHLACHLDLDEQHPWQSRLRLASGQSNAGLRAAEIAAQTIPADLVFLASCESAGGRILPGEGLLGISSAFLSAGASSIVATLWPVDDRVTARLVERFYAELARGNSVGKSLARAQQALAQKPSTSHPFYWAGFVLVGDPDTRVPLRPRRSVPPAAIGTALLLLMAGVLFELRRRRTRQGPSVLARP